MLLLMYCFTTTRQSVMFSRQRRSPTMDICELSGAGLITPNALDSANHKTCLILDSNENLISDFIYFLNRHPQTGGCKKKRKTISNLGDRLWSCAGTFSSNPVDQLRTKWLSRWRREKLWRALHADRRHRQLRLVFICLVLLFIDAKH